jgi:hypothetical protein
LPESKEINGTGFKQAINGNVINTSMQLLRQVQQITKLSPLSIMSS